MTRQQEHLILHSVCNQRPMPDSKRYDAARSSLPSHTASASLHCCRLKPSAISPCTFCSSLLPPPAMRAVPSQVAISTAQVTHMPRSISPDRPAQNDTPSLFSTRSRHLGCRGRRQFNSLLATQPTCSQIICCVPAQNAVERTSGHRLLRLAHWATGWAGLWNCRCGCARCPAAAANGRRRAALSGGGSSCRGRGAGLSGCVLLREVAAACR